MHASLIIQHWDLDWFTAKKRYIATYVLPVCLSEVYT